MYSFSGPDSSSVTATKRVHMKVDNKVSTLEGCFLFSRPSLSAYFALKSFYLGSIKHIPLCYFILLCDTEIRIISPLVGRV